MKIKIETTVKADLADVWSAWITPQDINQWNFASDDWHNPSSTNDLRIGGHFSYRMEAKDGSVGFDFEGTYTRIVEKALIEYLLGDDRSVSIEFTPVDNGVKVVETFDTEDENTAERQKHGWQNILNNFKRHVEAKFL